MAPTDIEILHFFKRDNSTAPPCTEAGCEAMPVSTWQKSGIPIIIGVVLFIIAFIVLFFIVRKRRRQNRAEEDARDKRIDMEDMEDGDRPIQHGVINGKQKKKEKKKNKKSSKEEAPDVHLR